jgi:hypothetical protein
MEELYSDKILTLADWLETSDLDAETIILDIKDLDNNEFYYDGETYLVLSKDEVNERLNSYSQELINEIEEDLDKCCFYYAHYIMVNEDAVKADESVEQIGEEYSEFNGYYIFTM